MESESLPLLNKLIDMYKQHKNDKVFVRLLGEAIWLKQELEKGRLKLPIKSTQDLFLFYAVGEDLLHDTPDAKLVAEQLMDILLDHQYY